MNTFRQTDQNWTHQAVAVAAYVLLVGVFIGATWTAFSTVANQYAVVSSAETMLAQLQGRVPPAAKDGRPPLGAAPAGSPFLEGESLTVAGAALLERVGGAVTRIGGNILSSQVELQKADSKDGWIGLIVSCEIDPASLQPLLYDLEAGMPFLFIEQLVVQAPVVGVEKSRMRVLFDVSGLWGGKK